MVHLYKFTDEELKVLLSSLVVLVDSREKENAHIIDYFKIKNVAYKSVKLDVGDYGGMLPKNDKLGIVRDLYFPMAIERKNSIDELINNFKADKRTAFQNELIRSQGMDFVLIVEQESGYKDILNHKYRSEMKPQSVIGTLKAFESRYGFNTIFIDKQLSPVWIHHHLHYRVRNFLKRGC